MAIINQERLKELVEYDQNTGKFTMLVDHGDRLAGDPAGSEVPGEYAIIYLDGRAYPAHRLAFLYMTGDWPAEFMDHINGDRSDNRWKNLREATHAENMRNRKMPVNNSTGYKGVRRRRSRWQACIGHNGKTIRLGTFDTPQEASMAYEAAAKQLFGDFARPR